MGMKDDLDWFFAQLQTMGVSERYRNATLAEMYYSGRQYHGLPAHDDLSVPFEKRAPKIIVPLFKEAVDEIIRFTWGGNCFPSVSVEATRTADEDGDKDEPAETPDAIDDEDDVGPRLNKNDAEVLTRFVRALVRNAELPRAVKEASRMAAIGTSAALILGVKGGYITTHVERGKHCTPVPHKQRPRRLESLEIKYQYEKEVEETPGKLRKVPYWYRRLVTSTRDVTYLEVPVVPGFQPTWTEDPERSVDFGYDLGEAPVVWFRPLGDDADQVDGTPLIDPQLYPLIDDVNRVVSQRSRAIRYVTDPQPVVTGLEEGEIDFTKGTKPVYLPDAEADVKFLEMTGVGIQRATEHVEHLTQAFRDAVHFVKGDPKTTSGNISGVVLEFLHAPMIALAADLRADFGDGGYCVAIALLLQMCVMIRDAGKDVWVQGVGKATEILKAAQLRGVWLDPPICLHWPPYFPETAADKQQKVAYTVQAQQASFISKKTATKHLGPLFNVEDPDAEHEEVDAEADEAMKREVGPMGAGLPGGAGGAPPKTNAKGETVPEEGET